jgi:hypothetical protein
MRHRGWLVALKLLAVLVTAQGCALNGFLLELFIAAGRIPPLGPIPCGEQSVVVPPGTCSTILNVCREDLQFIPGDSFAFDDPPERLSVRRTDGRVDICAAAAPGSCA